MGCQKAQGFLELHELSVASKTDAGKEKKGRAEALKLARSFTRVVVGRGKKVVVLDLKNATVSDDELANLILGPTGNLKAPTLQVGDTLLVGYSEEAYRQELEAR